MPEDKGGLKEGKTGSGDRRQGIYRDVNEVIQKFSARSNHIIMPLILTGNAMSKVR